MYINTNFFEVIGPGEIEIKKDGIYLISGEISVVNLPRPTSGVNSVKYILGLFVDDIRRGYFSRGFVSLPSATNYWGTTGTIMYKLNAGQKVKVRYVLNAGGAVVTSNFLNIGITKL